MLFLNEHVTDRIISIKKIVMKIICVSVFLKGTLVFFHLEAVFSDFVSK